LAEGRGSELARMCWEEVRKRAKRGERLSAWEKERQEFFEMRGRELKEVEEERERGIFYFSKVEEWDRNKQRQERWAKISESRHNKWYKRVKGEGIPEYLKKSWVESRWRIARYRMGKGIKEGMYWAGEEERMCRMCGKEEETCVGGLWKMGEQRERGRRWWY